MARRLRLGVALGGGGARGFAHLGVLIALERGGIPVDVVTGTSLGAAMGAARALAMDLPRLARVLGCLDLNALLQVSSGTMREIQRAIGRGVIEYVRGPTWRDPDRESPSTTRMRDLFSLLTGGRTFADAVLPFAAIAADLETGEQVILREGSLGEAIAASTAVPGVFPPVSHDGRYLIDGGILDKIPVDVAIDLGAEAVVAVDTGAPLTREVHTSFDALLQSERITSRRLTALQLDLAAEQLGGRLLVIRPPIGWMTMFEFAQLPQAVAAGETAAREKLDEISDMLHRRRRISPRWSPRRTPPRHEP
ncbi:MAG: patatin-like phospholipase family protein [Candidatus Bipolaricaulota bacterium]|nr:MAG: patatin-like phospholipase family protein [Candidatus Bipolaricaulota bacterium]